MKTTHGSFTRSAGAPIHHHRGSCQGNIRRKYSFSSFFLLFTWAVASEILEENILFFRHLCSHLKNISKKDISYFTYSLRFFLSSPADMNYYWTIFVSFFSPPTSMDGQRNFFPSLHRASEKYYEFFCCLRTFFSSYVSGWTEKEKIFPQSLYGVFGKYYENIFCLRIFFLLLHLWMNRRRKKISTDFAQSVWEFKRFYIYLNMIITY